MERFILQRHDQSFIHLTRENSTWRVLLWTKCAMTASDILIIMTMCFCRASSTRSTACRYVVINARQQCSVYNLTMWRLRGMAKYDWRHFCWTTNVLWLSSLGEAWTQLVLKDRRECSIRSTQRTQHSRPLSMPGNRISFFRNLVSSHLSLSKHKPSNKTQNQ